MWLTASPEFDDAKAKSFLPAFLKRADLVHGQADSRCSIIGSDDVARRAREVFGETSIRTLNTRYMQLRDEDIIIEEKPKGSIYVLTTGFVYDEFME